MITNPTHKSNDIQSILYLYAMYDLNSMLIMSAIVIILFTAWQCFCGWKWPPS